MEDIAPGLLEEIQRLYQSGKNASEVLQEISQMLQDGRITYADANRAAREIGKVLSGAYQTVLSSEVLPDGRMYYNIADRVVGTTLTEAYGDVADIAEQTQNILNRNAGIGLKAVRPELNQDKVKGIVNRLSSEAVFDDIKWILDSPVVAFCQNIVDESVRQNVDFQGRAVWNPESYGKQQAGAATGAAPWQEHINIRMCHRMCTEGMITATVQWSTIPEAEKSTRISGQRSGNMKRILIE